MGFGKLSGMETGLVKVVAPYMGQIDEELALKLEDRQGYVMNLPNAVLPFAYWLRTVLKNNRPDYFFGNRMQDSHIERIENRVIILNEHFYGPDNKPQLLIGMNSPYYHSTIDEIARTLLNEGFDITKKDWEEYKAWQSERMKKF